LNASFDSTQQRLYISSKTAGAAGNFDFSALENDSDSASALSVLGLSTSYPDGKDYDDLSDAEKNKFAKKLEGTDAEITLNGVKYTSDTNNFAINGLNITVTGVTSGDDEISLTTDTDSQGIYDKIKDFLTEYNSVINEMTKLYNADSSYGYDPLTDDEKDAMSDTEIEKWETKIKDSLLRNDTTLNSVMMSMINTMSSTYEVNGTKMSLSSLGISTLGYLNAAENENYAYHIDGDSDDENTSGNTDKLMAAIKSDPDSVISFMKQLSSTLYTKLGDKMKSTTLSSAYTIYNDKEMNSQYSEYSKTISNWEDKLSDKEDYYYEKFASMESALSTLQSQTSSLTSMFSS
jgi:flagellar hook-associated protein 2